MTAERPPFVIPPAPQAPHEAKNFTAREPKGRPCLWKFLAAAIYRVAYKLHHILFLRKGVPLYNARLIVVGSFLAGGAGKTPFTAWISDRIHERDKHKRIAVLCHPSAKDEAQMLKKKIPFANVVTAPNRYKTAHRLDRDFDYVICDDGFEDSRLAGHITIRLDSENLPQGIRDLIPLGKCRSLVLDHPEPQLILDRKQIQFRISSIENCKGESITDNIYGLPKTDGIWDRCCKPGVSGISGESIQKGVDRAWDRCCKTGNGKVYGICGIGDPERFRHDLEQYLSSLPHPIELSGFIARPDHDRHFEQTIQNLLQRMEANATLITTEKDFHRLEPTLQGNPRIFVAQQQVALSEQAVLAVDSLIFHSGRE